MQATIVIGLMSATMFLTRPAVAQTPAAAPTHVMVTPTELRWQGTRDISYAVVEGDPEKSGEYSVMYRLANGRWIAPHWHPNPKRVVVLSGTVLMGLGESGDTSRVKALPAGSFALVPARTVHYEGAQGETVVLFTGEGPLATHFTGRQPRRP